MKKLVLDTSAVVAGLLPDEKANAEVTKYLLNASQTHQLVAPNLLPYEVGNVLKSGVIRKRLTVVQAKKLFRIFLGIGITYEQADLEKTLKYALKHKLSMYDAAYLAVAKKYKCKLLTLDKKLKNLS